MKEVKGLYLVTDAALCLQAGRCIEDAVAAALKGGAKIIQLRDKKMPEHDFLSLAWRIKTLADYYGALTIINDHVSIAKEIGASGVHIGQDDMKPDQTRALLGPDAIIGLSVETIDQARLAIALPKGTINYLGVSPVFETPTKTDFQHSEKPWGLEGLRQLRALTSLPLVAIGGINLHNAKAVIDAGADSVAVASAICSAKDSTAAVEAFCRLFS